MSGPSRWQSSDRKRDPQGQRPFGGNSLDPMCSTPCSAEHQVVWEVVWNRSYERLTMEREKRFELSTSTLAK